MEPYQRLAMEVIKSAIDDLQAINKRMARLTAKIEQEPTLEYTEKLKRCISDKDEITKFFDDEEWCGFWCDISGVTYEALVDRVRGLEGDCIRQTKAVQS